jgi:AbrB family looped-hinge helix DNA binding protein
MAAMDVHGRLSDRSVLDALGWAPGTAIGMDVEDGLGGPAAVAVTGGSGRITVAGQLRLPARIRHRLGLRAGDRVLLAGHPAVARLVCYPPATLDAVLAAVATSASGDRE